ncbi:MAG: PilN domain-containing protein [Bacillota bacterium]
MRVNLIKNKKRKRRFRVNWLRVAVTCLAFIIIMTGIYKYWILRENAQNLESEIESYKQTLLTYGPVKKEYRTLEDDIEELNEFVDVRDVEAEPWGEALINFGYMVPEKIMLENIEIDREQVTLAGLADSESNLIDFLNSLSSSSLFTEVDLEDIDKQEDVIFTIILKLDTGG